MGRAELQFGAVRSVDGGSIAPNGKAAVMMMSPGDRIKILQLCAVDFTAYHFLLPLARSLSQQFEVQFACAPGPYVEKIEAEGFKFHPIPFKRSYDIFSHSRSLWQLGRLIHRERYDLVHTHTPIASLIGRIAAKAARVPVILYTAHGFYFHDRMPARKRQAFIWLEKLGGMFTDFTFTQSREDMAAAVALGLAGQDRIQHIGNGIDLTRFDPAGFKPGRKEQRRAIGLDDYNLAACIIGRLVREKGYFELLEAFALVIKELPQARLIVIGGALDSDHDDAESEIRARADGLGLNEAVNFLSFRKDVEAILSAVEVFVLPSHREGMPRSILEAMAMELPVVATLIRGSREEVEDGKTGILVEVGDVEGLAKALIDLLQHPEKRAVMGQNGRQAAVRRFDENMVIQNQIGTIRRLLAEKGLT
jgi:glycosyltransferase involved in cell wall biosynthesis